MTETELLEGLRPRMTEREQAFMLADKWLEDELDPDGPYAMIARQLIRTAYQAGKQTLMKWDDHYGPREFIPTMWVKRLLHIRGFRLDLHKFIAADGEQCYHTHPARAFRLVLFGGYTEEVHGKGFKEWRPGMFGFVRPELCHRIAKLRNDRVSYSLWLRWPVSDKIRLVGNGWRNFKADET